VSCKRRTPNNSVKRTAFRGRLPQALGATTNMSEHSSYEETVLCEARQDEGVVLIKVVAMPHEGSVEFDITQARAFAERILAAVEVVESGWVGKSGAPPAAGGGA